MSFPLLRMMAFVIVSIGLSAGVRADLYWDTNGANAGSTDTPPDAPGTWDGVTANWSMDSGGGVATQAWTPDEFAVFSAGGDATGVFTVTFDGTQSAGGLRFEEGTVTIDGGTELTLTGGATVEVGSFWTATINSTLGGSAGLNQSGAGTLILNGANTYSGNTFLASNTILGTFNILRLGPSGLDRIPDTSIVQIEGQNTRFELDGQTETVKSIASIDTGAGALANSAIDIGTGTLILDDEMGEVSTYQGSVFVSGTGKLIKNGDGQINLTATNGSWDGEFELNSGILGIGVNNTLGLSSNGTARLTINGGTIQPYNLSDGTPTGNRTLQTQNVDIGGDFTYGGTQNLEFFGAAESTPFGNEGSVIVTLKNSVAIDVPNQNAILIFRGRVLDDGQERGITKTGPGVLTLRHPNNAYGGDTTVLEGQLRIDADTPIGDGTGTLNLSGGSLNTTATRDVSTAAIVNPVNVTASSVITTTHGVAATVDLNFASDNITGSSGATLTFQNIATGAGPNQFEPRFSGSGFNLESPIVIAAGANAATRTTRLSSANATGTQTFSGEISGEGVFRRMAGGTTVFTAANTYSGGTEVEGGTLSVSGASATLGTGDVTVTGGLLDIASGVTNAIANTATLSLSGTGMANLGAGIDEQVAGLLLDGLAQPSGTYGSSSSGATNQFDVWFTGTGILTVSAAVLDGDYNGDGMVDAADYVVWRKDPASFGGDPGGYDTWRANFGASSGSGAGGGSAAGAGAVPEPATAALLALFAGAMLAGCRRRRSG